MLHGENFSPQRRQKQGKFDIFAEGGECEYGSGASLSTTVCVCACNYIRLPPYGMRSFAHYLFSDAEIFSDERLYMAV